MFENPIKTTILFRRAGCSPRRRCWREQANQFLAIRGRYQPTSHPRPSPLAPLVAVTFPSLPVPLEQSAQNPPSPLSLILWACLMRTSESSRLACFHLPLRSEIFNISFTLKSIFYCREVSIVHSRKTQIKFSDEDFVTINPDDQATGHNT